MKILILKEFDVIETVECLTHTDGAPSHTKYIVSAGDCVTNFEVCSLDAVARPDMLEAPAPADESPLPPGVPS